MIITNCRIVSVLVGASLLFFYGDACTREQLRNGHHHVNLVYYLRRRLLQDKRHARIPAVLR